MGYDMPLYRPPSEADAFILQATIGCSWNHCTYCDMYRSKSYRVRPLDECLADIATARHRFGERVQKLFVADGDALGMPMAHWMAILDAARAAFPRLRRVSSYAMASNVLDKTPAELSALRKAGLTMLYVGPESGDDLTLKRIAKGATADDFARAADAAHEADLRMSVIVLLGAGGVARSAEHAAATAALVTRMDPAFLAALTLTVLPDTPQARLMATGRFELPDLAGLMGELRVIIDAARPTNAVFRTNHASNHLPLAGTLPRDRARILATIDAALDGRVPLRPEASRGL